MNPIPPSLMMQRITGCSALQEVIATCRARQETIGFVPTMGALHDGHLSLVRHSKANCRRTIVSIFVNPTQFGEGEDFKQYPRSIDEDLALLERLAVDFVFVPPISELYPPEFSTIIQPPQVSRVLEGECRPKHFQGVATIVLKLFGLVQPTTAFFGQKDFQQALVIRNMVRDLNIPVDVFVCPTLRDDDGLALSSRNRYLNTEHRRVARSIYQCLQGVRKSVLDGETDGRALMAQMQRKLLDDGVSSIDYAVVCDPESLAIAASIQIPVVALIACRVGTTRLIDNILIE